MRNIVLNLDNKNEKRKNELTLTLSQTIKLIPTSIQHSVSLE